MERFFKDQYIAAGIGAFNSIKQARIDEQLTQVVRRQMAEHKAQNLNFENALIDLAKIRVLLSSPENILGTARTKHGEVAEFLEVHVRNAKDILVGLNPSATFEGVKRTAAEDYILNGIKIQSKFVGSVNGTLNHVFRHFEMYQDDSIQYMIPRDQYSVIEQIRSNQIPSALSNKATQGILKNIEKLERRTERSFEELCNPSISSYEEVQLGNVFDTVTKHHEDLIDQNHDLKQDIDWRAKDKTKALNEAKKPSVGEGLKVAGGAAAISATIAVLSGVYTKIKSGKNLGDFDAEDWKELGLDGSIAGGIAFLSASSIYALTNVTALSAPFAASVTSASIGIAKLARLYKNGEIDADEVVTGGQVLCFEAGVVAIGSALGQLLIPVPILGAFVGAMTTKYIWELTKGKIGEREAELKELLDQYSDSLLRKLDDRYRELVTKIEMTYARFNSLIDAAFDLEMNVASLAAASIKLAEELGVQANKIIHNEDDLDAFFLL